MITIQKRFQSFVERNSFGVCSFIAEKWGLNEGKVRLYFIYTSFVGFGSPVVFYLAAAFWINIKKYIQSPLSLR